MAQACPWPGAAVRRWLTPALAGVALAVLPATPATAEPGEPGGQQSISALLTELRGLHREAREAEQAYEETERRLRERRERVDEVSERLASTRTELADAHDLVGRLAREQYRGGGIQLPPALRLLLGEDPGDALRAETIARRAAADHARTLEHLLDGERGADRLARQEREALDAEQATASEQRQRRDAARTRISEITTQLATLPDAQLDALATLEDQTRSVAPAPGTTAAPRP